MGTGVRELKHESKLQEWSVRIAECRSSGMGVKAWCAAQGIALKTYYNWERQIVKAATQHMTRPESVQSGMLMRVIPDELREARDGNQQTGITIRHGESIITFPSGSGTEVVAELVKALNRHA